MLRIRLSQIAVGRTLQAAPESAWDLLTDTTKWPLWGPSVRRISSSDRYIRRGSWGLILTPFGLRLPFMITEYVHGHYWTWIVGGLHATGHRLTPLSSGSCTISFEMPLYWFPYVLVCVLALRRMARILET